MKRKASCQLTKEHVSNDNKTRVKLLQSLLPRPMIYPLCLLIMDYLWNVDDIAGFSRFNLSYREQRDDYRKRPLQLITNQFSREMAVRTASATSLSLFFFDRSTGRYVRTLSIGDGNEDNGVAFASAREFVMASSRGVELFNCELGNLVETIYVHCEPSPLNTQLIAVSPNKDIYLSTCQNTLITLRDGKKTLCVINDIHSSRMSAIRSFKMQAFGHSLFCECTGEYNYSYIANMQSCNGYTAQIGNIFIGDRNRIIARTDDLIDFVFAATLVSLTNQEGGQRLRIYNQKSVVETQLSIQACINMKPGTTKWWIKSRALSMELNMDDKTLLVLLDNGAIMVFS